MLFVCIMFVCFTPEFYIVIIYTNVFCFHALSLGYRHTACLFQLLFCIMYDAFSQLGFIIYAHIGFVYERAMCSLIALYRKITIIIIIRL